MSRQTGVNNLNHTSAKGFLYVLSNPTMPGLIKIGKTSRDPTDRVRELSAATGVATPFVLIYSQPTNDCNTTEKWVHQELEQRGYRMNAGREFFSCPVHEAVEVILAANSIAASQGSQSDSDETATSIESSIEIQSEEIYTLALRFYLGEDGSLSNPRKAIQLCKQASDMGHAQAASLAARIYRHGMGSVRADPEKALEYFKIAINRGVWPDIASVAMLFESADRQDTAEKYWVEFFDYASDELEREKFGDELQDIVAAKAFWYLLSCYEHRLRRVVAPETLAPFANSIARYFIEKTRAQNTIDTHRRYQSAISFVHKHLNLIQE